MAAPSTASLYAWAWRNVHKLPDAPVRGIAHLVGDLVWLKRGGGVVQLERNLARLRPDLDQRELRRVSRAGMRSYMRYFAEAFQLPGWSTEQIDARVRGVGWESARAAVDGGSSTVLALGHSGNWDLAGAWASRTVAPVLTVAEKLPDGLYEEFVSFRNTLGIEIVPLDGPSTFRTLLRAAKARPQIVPLLADRDLTSRGILTTIAGNSARVAAGPAALALTLNSQVYPVSVYYERLRGEQRRRAGTPWGLVVHFLPPIASRDEAGVKRDVAAVTQDWVSSLFASYADHPQDWHMLQKVFLADLDPARLAAQQPSSSPEAG